MLAPKPEPQSLAVYVTEHCTVSACAACGAVAIIPKPSAEASASTSARHRRLGDFVRNLFTALPCPFGGAWGDSRTAGCGADIRDEGGRRGGARVRPSR